MIDESLRAFLAADLAIADLAEEIAVGQVPIDDTGEPLIDSYIWFQQFDEDDWLDLDGLSGMTEFVFDVECVSTNILTAKTLAQRVRALCQGFGYDQTMNGGTVTAGYVESKDDSYVPVNRFQETNTTVTALTVTLYTDDTINDT